MEELAEYLAEVGHDMTVDEALLRVQEDDGDDAFQDFVVMLADNGDIPDPETAQEFAMELFNYFPRKSLGGKSLAEKMPFDELKKLEEAFQNFKNGTGSSDYSYTLPKE
mgnify:CR=1 FL=1